MKHEKFSGSGNDTNFQAFLDQFEVCAKVNNWNEEEKANQLILCMKEETRVVVTPFTHSEKLAWHSKIAARYQLFQWLGQGVLVMWIYMSFPKELPPRKLPRAKDRS